MALLAGVEGALELCCDDAMPERVQLQVGPRGSQVVRQGGGGGQ